MSDDDVREKVAKAIARATNDPRVDDSATSARYRDALMDHYLRLADAAIAAMDEGLAAKINEAMKP